MKTKITLISVLLLTAILISSCAGTTQPPQETQNTDVFSSEGAATTTEEPVDPFSAVRASGETWISYGLRAYESGKEILNLKDFFSDQANLTFLTLYDHFFTYDKAKARPVAEAFFAFVVNEYGVDALLDLEKRVEYKDAYLKSLGLDALYNNAQEVEAFLSTMDFSSSAAYKYIISFDNVTYYFKDFNVGSPSQYHGMLYFSTIGLRRMTEYLRENGLDEGLDTSRQFDYYMTFNGSPYSKTVYATGNMYINDAYSTLHEAMHAMGIRKESDIWFTEGLCNYFGKVLGFNDQIAASNIQILKMTEAGYFNESAKKGDAAALQAIAIYKDYVAHGGKMDSAEGFDFRLYYDVRAKAELDSGKYETIGEAYKTNNNRECDSIGKELSYEQATSLVVYLVDKYGIDKVMEAYRADAPSDVFGKDYESLKADWLADMNSKYAS